MSIARLLRAQGTSDVSEQECKLGPRALLGNH
eukprot:CAMPEP_0195103672 /NCGR_PEP_ID=MMETSP0448-20130528/72649_1 /TAXON_ID=66468 /ORGANISM="Heterocapsa triquestra, Strain CCMP 448" /LENGTH=31 /DNA_ID= /DNA_START= /DNA_END= /DNA_ORIENTATION=